MNVLHTFWSLLIICGLSTRESASVVYDDEQGDLLSGKSPHWKLLATPNAGKKVEGGFGGKKN